MTMTGKKIYNSDGRSSEDKALDKFAEMMIEKIKTLQNDWKKPWFTDKSISWPRNLSGREYNGMNALLLMMHCEKQGYKLPVFCTFDRVAGLNYTKDKQGVRQQIKDNNGQELPKVSILKGEKSFPVFITTFTVVDKETKEKIKYDDYKLLSEEEKKGYNVYPKLQVYNVFNVAQTNRMLSHSKIDTVFLTTSLEYAYLSSSAIKQIASFDGDITPCVPDFVADLIYEKYRQKKLSDNRNV